MDADRLQSSAERDQLWASMRRLLPEIRRLAQGEFGGTEREQQVIQLLARVIAAEMAFRAENLTD
jgi:hypothetical protein